ncbi:hypothetical protein [Desulforhopalus vacuolatus]|uniref:hypothetical protein n=1 Tax=Desulforhopalus vacuolatus TaxID=40414 RepID=UPI0019623051|nr:hypothetical protein [Desulforhopalus vacuolatus]
MASRIYDFYGLVVSFHRYRYVYRHRVDKACLVSTTPLLKSLLCRFFTNDV